MFFAGMSEPNAKVPIAFLSYAHLDDEESAGAITKLRERLALAVSATIGRKIEIFQDCDAIAWGKQWQGRLNEALGQAQFLLPIVTPSYFTSDPCRAELEKFATLEREANRSDLILPLYFRTIRDFNTSRDPLVRLISRRQYRDWRDVRNKPLDDPEIRQKIDELADELGEAMTTSLPTMQALTRAAGSGPEPQSAAPVIEPALDSVHLSELRARVDKLEEERTEHEATIRALQSARTTLQEELVEARRERPASAGATPEGEPTLASSQPEKAGRRARLLTAAPALGLGIAIGGVGVWVAMETTSEMPPQGGIDLRFEEQLRKRQVEIASLESRASEAEATVAELQNRVVAERQEKEELQRQLAEARASNQAAVALASEPSEFWRDCEECPWMISLPGGSFTMGSPEDEEGHSSDEGPQREVTVQPFAMGQYEVTFDEWEACVKDGGCTYKPDDRGWGRGKRPVINVSWNDAQEYVAWLKAKTGKPYRLPSEAEWEYASRAGTKTPYWWGVEITLANANFGNDVGKTTEVGQYPSNPWGLHDTAGNVWEWCEDCWNGSYDGAPEDGSAWLQGDCSWRVVRGGSWDDLPWGLRSAYRFRFGPDFRFDGIGFRVSRTLTP